MKAINLLVLSPHYDDAVFSCGGEIVQRTAMDQWVVVVNVCSEPPTTGEISAFAAEHVDRWLRSADGVRVDYPELGGGLTGSNDFPGDGETAPGDMLAFAERMVEARHAEDAAALKRLGADWVRLGLSDAIFRRVVGPEHPYASVEALFGPLDPRESDLMKLMTLRLANLPAIGPNTRVLAPLAIGGHVDHRLTRVAAEAWRDLAGIALAYYEDLPYAAHPAHPGEATRELGLTRHLAPMSTNDLESKIDAMSAYRSQISTFWSSELEMADDVRRWADAAASDPTLPAGILGEWRQAASSDEPEIKIV